MLNGLQLSELPLDFLGTTYFTDVYVRKELLGSGAFGVVVKVIEKSSGRTYAMKVVFPTVLPA